MLELVNEAVWGGVCVLTICMLWSNGKMPRRVVMFIAAAAAAVLLMSVIQGSAVAICETLFVFVAMIAYLNLEKRG